MSVFVVHTCSAPCSFNNAVVAEILATAVVIGMQYGWIWSRPRQEMEDQVFVDYQRQKTPMSKKRNWSGELNKEYYRKNSRETE